MRHIIASVVLALVVFVVSCAGPQSIQALQLQGQTFCTAFSINQVEGWWVTARHCAEFAEAMGKTLNAVATIEDAPIIIMYMDQHTDVAVVYADAHESAFVLATQPVPVGNALTIIGYPYGLPRTMTKGSMAARDVPLSHPNFFDLLISDVYDVTVAGGNSGSPVLNQHGEVVGLLWGGFPDAPLAIGVPLHELRRAVQDYVER